VPRRLDSSIAGPRPPVRRALFIMYLISRVLAGEQVLEPGGLGKRWPPGKAGEARDHAQDATVGGNRDHAGGNALENGFREAAAALELAAVASRGASSR